jgi:acyl-CoA reductase-like NAD-dependent aldehyde dehydrogenase
MTFQSHNPATGELIGTYPEHDEVETNVRLQRAWEGWLRWSRTPLRERRAFLIRLADLLDERAETYGRLITAEMGKPLPDAIAKIKKSALDPARRAGSTAARRRSAQSIHR